MNTTPTASSNTFDATDISDILDTLVDTTNALEALNILLEYAHCSGDDLSSYSSGIDRLFNQQCDDLKVIRKALEEQFQEVRASRLEVRDVDAIAEYAGINPKRAALAIFAATGVRLEELSEAACKEAAVDARQGSLARALEFSVSLDGIAEATSLPVETVHRVLDEAYAFSPRRTAAALKARKEREEAAYAGA